MKTFQKLEEKLGTDAAKQVYELAEAIYEELERKYESKFDQFQLSITDPEHDDTVRKAEMRALRKELTTTLNSFKEEQNNAVNAALSKFKKSISKVTFFLFINLIFTLLIILYLVKPIILNGGL
jgi:hypothetical protein